MRSNWIVIHEPAPRALELIERTRDALAVAIRAAFYRDRLRALLEETQRQSETLRVQQEELRVANEPVQFQRTVEVGNGLRRTAHF